MYDRQHWLRRLGCNVSNKTVRLHARSCGGASGEFLAASQPRVIDNEWDQYLDYLFHSNSLVETIYQLDKAGAFDGAGTPEGKTLADERLAAGAIELRDLIYSAWVHSADPVQEYQGPA